MTDVPALASREGACRIPALMLHGLTGAPADLQVVTKCLRLAGHRVEAPMLPGHGVGERELLETGWRHWLQGAEAALITLTDEAGPAVVGGLSMGAVLALALAIRQPERVAGLACFAPTLRYDGWVIPRGSWFIPIGARLPLVNRYRFKERPPYGLKDERLRAKMAELLLSGAVKEAGLAYMPGRSLAQNLDLIRWTSRRLHRITAPMLLVHAVDDDITHIRNAERLAAAVSGPVQKLYLEDSYHLVTLDRERRKVAQAALEFIASLNV